MSDTNITCPRCGGSGHTALDPALNDALEALREGAPATSADVHRRMAARGYLCGHTATINQLTKLIKLGFAIRCGKRRKAWLYRVP